MKIFGLLVVMLAAAIGGWWFWNHNPTFRNFLAEYVDNGEFLTLEARFTPEQIMDSRSKELLPSDQHSYEEPQLKFHPYVLMEVKYSTPDKKTREGVILWSLVDGEMVLNAETWDKTHGFEDAIRVYLTAANVYRNEPEMLEALSQVAACYRQLNRPEEARGTIVQAKAALARMDKDVNFTRTTNFSREEWGRVLDQMATL